MRTYSERKEIKARLRQLATQLDCVIEQAIENPLVFAESPLLLSIESECAHLMAYAADQQGAKPGLAEPRMLADLVWEIRARAGRLQRLLDSAARFYTTCFASPSFSRPRPADGLAYGVHGEWEGVAGASHLSVDY